MPPASLLPKTHHFQRVKSLRRRDLLAAGLALPFIGRPLSAALVVRSAGAGEGRAVRGRRRARARARARAKPYKAPDNKLPDALKDLTYDRYRMIRFKPDQALWRAEGLPFQLQFFHRGFYYANRVDIFEVKDGARDPDRLFAQHVLVRRPAGAGRAGQSRLRGLSHPRADQPAGLFRRDRRVPRRELFPRGRQGPDLRAFGARPVAQHRRPEGRGVPELHAPSGSSGRPRARPRSWCMRCSTARARPRPIASPSAPARPRSTTSRRRCFRACRSSRPGLATLTSMYFFGAERPRRRR